VDRSLYVSDDEKNAIVRISGFPNTILWGTVALAVTGELLEGIRVRVVQAHPPSAGRMVATDENGNFSL
jgi:hypothetical protein